MLRFFSIFLVLLVVLFVGELTPPVQQWLIVPWTSFLASASAFLVQAVDTNVVSYGKVLQNAKTGMGVSIEAGCNGVEACLILLAALTAYPARWRYKLVGIGIGFVAIQLVNLVRIITLFYLAGWNAQAFEFAHLYLWQALIMLDVVVVWLVWMRWVARQDFRREHLQAHAGTASGAAS
ncbi:exosortase H [Curvibacter gracilis]|uniref:exosortase H n=1 Tax=Curvibacter gracilis TaxID=230310 RepID=UPI0004AF1ABD|nr:exosortase H [Curvibacter gracilis]